MQKTTEITFEGVTATISSDYAPKKVSVTVTEPNIEEMLESMNAQDLKNYVTGHFDIDELFTEKELKKWAEDNGYIKE